MWATRFIMIILPPPDSPYKPNEIIVKFRPNALLLNKLCYGYPGPPIDKRKGDSPLNAIPNYLYYGLRAQRFYVDSLIADSVLLQTIKSFGGDTLRRITVANPCVDTISISRYGDTLLCEDFLWMVLHISNDTSVITACFLLTYYHQDLVEGAQPIYYLRLADRDPYPYDLLFASNQWSLQREMIGVTRAWDFTVGSESIKVGVIDSGVDWEHCDLGSGFGPEYKVAGGRNLTDPTTDIDGGLRGVGRDGSPAHGTQVCGVIGALTHRSCAASTNGVAGIAGGWGPDLGPDLGFGCKLYVYRALDPTNISDLVIPLDQAVTSIQELSADSPNSEYGYGVHVLNNSYSFGEFDEVLRAAVNYAFIHGVSFVAARGNVEGATLRYPACTTPESWVISVGGSKRNRNRVYGSAYGEGMDLLAPVGVCSTNESNVWTTTWSNPELNLYDCFSGTSSAAPHVSGTIALLRSYALEQGWNDLEPEDYEGMIKASCRDRRYDEQLPDETENYLDGYDEETGWGHLQADKLFDMLEDGYRITHYSIYPLGYGVYLNSTNEGFAFVNNPRNPSGSPETGYYNGKVIKYRRNYMLPTDKWEISPANKLYVWGRSGERTSTPSGYIYPEKYPGSSVYRVNYSTGFTRVVSGIGGNGLVDGIIHNDLEVTVETYQYELLIDDTYRRFPPDYEFSANISVFGKEIAPPSPVEKSVINSRLIAYITQMPAINGITLIFSLPEESGVKISICNILGDVVLHLDNKVCPSGLNHKDINISNLGNELYYLRIITSTDMQIVKLIVVK